MGMHGLVATVLIAIMGPLAAGTAAQADAARVAYEKSMEVWKLKWRLAESDQDRAELLKERPDPKAAAARMWRVIEPELTHEWALAPAAWFLQVASKVVETTEAGLQRPAMSEEMRAVRRAVGKHHLESPELAAMCMALVACGDQESLNLLRHIEAKNRDEKVQGVAALGVAMIAKSLGDDPKVVRERLSMLRKAIIQAADVKVAGTTVAELAEDELYIITSLTKGRQAPDLEGVDSGDRAMKLSDFEGKVVMLVFWSARSEYGAEVIRLIRNLKKDERFAEGEFEVVGVNHDPRDDLRALQKSGDVNWPNFSDPQNELAKVYRVGTFPLAYVLGGDRKIHYVGGLGTFAELTAAAVLEEE